MNRIIIALFSLLLTGCTAGLGKKEVTFEFFNLSTNEIWVTEVVGLPPWASPGRLIPSRDEGRLSVSALTSFETVRIQSRLKIVWVDNGERGWPGGLKPGELVPKGTAHESKLTREDLGIPATLNGTLRFTYLGGDKWRVRIPTAQESQ